MEGVELSQFRLHGEALRHLPRPWGGIYLLQYEHLQRGYESMMSDLGLPAGVALGRDNPGESKPLHEVIRRAFQSSAARRVRSLSVSRDSQFLGYHHEQPGTHSRRVGHDEAADADSVSGRG